MESFRKVPNADAFLPNGLRRQLGMMDNAQRYARDMYALQVMLRTREHVRIVVGKSDANGDPLTPSRLLMACDLAQLPDRVLHLVKEDAVDVLPAVEKRWKKTRWREQLGHSSPAVRPASTWTDRHCLSRLSSLSLPLLLRACPQIA